MEGNLVGSGEKNIRGETTFRWLPGGFFLEQRGHIDFMGFEVDALELIGYEPESDTFPSTVFSGFAPTPLPYCWDVRGDKVTISVTYGQLGATFTGSWREDGTFSGVGVRILSLTRPPIPPTTSAVTASSRCTLAANL
jgi:hypothetical protein